MVDFETLIASLQDRGHTVERAFEVPSNAGDAELIVDGQLLSLAQARELLVDPQPE